MLKKLKILSVCVACTAFFIFAIVAQPEAHNAYLRWEVGESVVQVVSPAGGGGTGFAIKSSSGEHYIVTNKHVCEAAVNGWMVIKQDTGFSPVFKKVVYKDSRHDLCLIQGDKRLSPLTLGSHPDKGNFHYIVGHPGLRQLTVSKGEYIGYGVVKLLDKVQQRSQCRGDIIELNVMQQILYGMEFACIRSYKSYSSTAVAYPGNSGSPVVNKYGNVIGVLFAGSNKEERDNYIVPLAELNRVLNKF